MDILRRLEFEENFSEEENRFFSSIDFLRTFKITSTEYLINQQLVEGNSILAEGAQGTLLDIDFGSYPFVTSSNTTTSGACTGLGIAPNKIREVFGIFKSYCTRVGSGLFPTELYGSEGEALRKKGGEFGATTGRPRRCGWLDLPALNYACMLNGVTQLFMMKADILSGMEKIKACDSYLVGDKTTKEFPYQYTNHFKPQYKDYSGWQLNDISNFERLPDALQSYTREIEAYTKTSINLISVGPDRSETILRKKG